MATELLMCISQVDIKEPYRFKLTGVNVFSFEEAIYYTFYNWRETYDDFISDSFIQWVGYTVGQTYLSDQIKKLKVLDEISDKLIKFLSLIDYFDPIQLATLKAEITLWENQVEWVRLKDRGNYLMTKNKPELAYSFYKKALAYEKNLVLYNNIGMACMKMELFGKAELYFRKAYELDKSNIQVIINLAESLIFREDFEEAFKYLKKAEKNNENSDVYYLYAKLCIENNNIINSIDYLNKAISIKEDNKYLYKLAEVYGRVRRYKDAFDTLNRIKVKDTEFFINESNIFVAYNDFSAAIKCMEKALVFAEGKKDINIWVKLATYHRLNYNLEKAELAINKALSLDAYSQLAKLEMAKIKKAQGKTTDYQSTLRDLIQDFKSDYRN